MSSDFRRLYWVCFFLLFFFLGSCSYIETLKKPEGEKDFPQEISRLEKLSQEHPDKYVREDSHLRLAYLYLDAKNPQLDYSRALQEMETYLSMSPSKPQTTDFQNWLAVLQEANRLRGDRIKIEVKSQGLQTQAEKIQSSLDKAQESNKSLLNEVASLKETNKSLLNEVAGLKEANKTLLNEVASLKDTIGKLKSLDLQMEEKRSLIK